MAIRIAVVQGDAFAFPSDVLIAKYAQRPYGLDRAILSNLSVRLKEESLPVAGDHIVLSGIQHLAASRVLLLGVEPLGEFGYPQIRDFARRAIQTLGDRREDVRSVLLTVHGPGYGLDEVEAFESEIAGLFDAISAGMYPRTLETITIIESDPRRAEKLSARLQALVPDGHFNNGTAFSTQALSTDSRAVLRSAGYASANKPHVFVAMPFAPEFNDLYHYGIFGAVKSAGMVCERADMSSFTGDVMSWVQARITSSRLVIADLTGSNPNVYLEVGYAWALRVPTVLIVNYSSDLKFDVRGQRVIEYQDSIRTLEERLTKELESLSGQHR